MQPPTRRWLLLAVLVGAALRFVPIWFGLPYPQARPDEETALGRALDVAGGQFNPRFFHWPSLTFYVFGGALWLAASVQALLGDARPLTFSENALVARAVVACAGTLTIPALFWLVRRAAGERLALLAATYLSVAILHVRDSHFAMTDVLMTLLVVLSLGCLVRAAMASSDDEAVRWCIAGGLACGLAASTKYSGGAVIVAIAAVQAVRMRRAPWPLGPVVVTTGAFCVAAAVGFVLGTPYAVLDFRTFAHDLRFDVEHLAGGHEGIELGRGWGYHLTHTLPYGVGLPVFAAAAAGVAPLVRTYPALAAVTGSFALVFYLVIGSGHTVFFRYMLPVVPVICLFAASGVMHVADWAFRRISVPPPVLVLALVGLTAGPSLVQSAWFDLVLARTDTRVLAGAWLEQRLDPATSVHDAGSAYTRLNIWRKPFDRWDYDAAAGRFTGKGGELPQWLVLYDSPLPAYTVMPDGLRDLASSRYRLEYALRPVGEGRGGLYDQQDAFFMPITGFQAVERPGPAIFIYRRVD
jgi:4-amino-4-deoxy-L-arabinose transferase-like glycosyltransferase